MACEVGLLGNIKNLRKIQEYFGLGHDSNWLSSVNVAFSPTDDLLVICQGEKMAALNSKWDDNLQTEIYDMDWCIELEDPNQIITSILCLPMFGTQSDSGPEWICVVIGLQCGMIVFYTDSGIKLYSQRYHDSPVYNIKVYTASRYSEAEPLLYITYGQCICCIKGSDFIPYINTLRYNLNSTFRNNKRPVQGVLEIADILQYQKYLIPHPMANSIVNDAIIIPFYTPCIFDHMVDQCLATGFYTKVVEDTLQSSIVITVGVEPYLGFYLAQEGYKSVSLRKMATDIVGSTYRNLMGNIFGQNPTSKAVSEESSNDVPCKMLSLRNQSYLFDSKRVGHCIALAPNDRLAVVVDNLDRVILVDTKNSVIIRIWKGYRDAQCGFIEVSEKTLKKVTTSQRKASFLVIYAPRLGCLEIWPLLCGRKIAAFTVCKNGLLIYNAYGFIALTKDINRKKRENTSQSNTCIFLDPNDCSLKKIEIPFHYALSNNNSVTSRDIHLLKRFRNLLTSVATDSELEHCLNEVYNLAAEFRTVEIRQQCLQWLLKRRQLPTLIFQSTIRGFEFVLKKQIDNPKEYQIKAIEEFQQFYTLVCNYQRLCDFYLFITDLRFSTYDEIEILQLSTNDKAILEQLILLQNSNSEKQVVSAAESPHVTFESTEHLLGEFIDFQEIFELHNKESISLMSIKLQKFLKINSNFFKKIFNHSFNIKKFITAAKESSIPSRDLLILILHFWLDTPFTYSSCDEAIKDMSHLSNIIYAVCELAGDELYEYDYNDISPWWQYVRELLLECCKSLSVVVAMTCKAIAQKFRRNLKKKSNSNDELQDEGEENWEQIFNDDAQWVLLIGKLEDIAILSAVLQQPIISCRAKMPEMPYELPDCSLMFILRSGQGIITDLTARWLINSRIHPSAITKVPSKGNDSNSSNNCTQPKEDTNQSKNIYVDSNEEDIVLHKLSLLRKHFPFSLESGVLLCLMSWHYMIYWSKNLSKLKYFEAALTCLQQFSADDYALKHGICCLIWQATIRYPLQATAKLVQKVGRLPLNKMCQQDLDMSAASVPEFLENCLSCLMHLSDSSVFVKRSIKFEELLVEGQLPVQYIALQQPVANQVQLKLFYELCSVLQFITFFQVRLPKPLTTLFDAMSNKAFYLDINKELPFTVSAADDALQHLRTEFLCSVITASMDLIREDLEELFIGEHVQYMNKFLQLGQSWSLDLEPLKQQQIIDLYAHGYDSIGVTLLEDLLPDENFGVKLLEIAGRRLNVYIEASKSNFLTVASVGQHLLQYLDNLDKYNNKSVEIPLSERNDIDVNALTNLAEITIKYLEYSQRRRNDLSIAGQLFDACCLLKLENSSPK